MAEVGAVSLGNSKFGLNLYNKIKQDSGKFLNQSVENLFCLNDTNEERIYGFVEQSKFFDNPSHSCWVLVST